MIKWPTHPVVLSARPILTGNQGEHPSPALTRGIKQTVSRRSYLLSEAMAVAVLPQADGGSGRVIVHAAPHPIQTRKSAQRSNTAVSGDAFTSVGNTITQWVE